MISDFCGSNFPRQVLTLNCDGFTFETISQLAFDFTRGVCSTNDNHIILCFSKQKENRCYKSISPTPEHLSQVVLTKESNFKHISTAISLSSYNTSGKFYTYYLA